jgi:hypothetical protein
MVHSRWLPTRVHRALDDSEVRWQSSAPLQRFRLVYSDISSADLTTLQSWFDSVKGGFDSTWDFTLGGVTYSYCALSEDAFRIQEVNPELFNLTLAFGQVKKSSMPAGSGGASFPALTSAIITRRPWKYRREFMNSRRDSPTGTRYAYYHRATPLMFWEVGGENLPDADVSTMLAYFVLQKGNRGTFSFTDPQTSTVYSTVRFDQEMFESRLVGPNEQNCYVRLAEVA